MLSEEFTRNLGNYGSELAFHVARMCGVKSGTRKV